ncbi:co-chaperone GroES [Paenibacillus turicensis]|jgi:chaperonin GroES|uniref:Co-chaperonin GroES n=1 Tax=Paenibacillus turicensis TaxID=160487 RepID=A0ABS4FLS0_9BACL|nr:co-chaperone GroES [Paenibacillus turicensis]MBP1903534.1 chaperonin GroES [Paenibacillus turicensis]
MIKPLGERVLVEAIEQVQTTASGLVLPDTAKEKPQEGKVIAVGSGVLKDGVRVPLEVKEGDRVLFSKYAGTEVKYEGKEYLIMKESDIHAVIE